MRTPLVSTQSISGAFNMLARPTNETEITQGFATITKAAKRDPDQALANLGEVLKTRSIQEIEAAKQNLRKISLIRLILSGGEIEQKAKKRHPKDYEQSRQALGAKYPELTDFVMGLIRPKVNPATTV